MSALRQQRTFTTSQFLTRTGLTPEHESGVRNSNLFGRVIEFHRKLDRSNLVRSVGATLNQTIKIARGRSPCF
jgi:hypothetical protein